LVRSFSRLEFFPDAKSYFIFQASESDFRRRKKDQRRRKGWTEREREREEEEVYGNGNFLLMEIGKGEAFLAKSEEIPFILSSLSSRFPFRNIEYPPSPPIFNLGTDIIIP